MNDHTDAALHTLPSQSDAPPPLLERVSDAQRFNEIAHHPKVFPLVRGNAAAIDLSAVVAHPANVALLSEHGGFIFVRLFRHSYEVHTLFEPHTPHGYAARAAKDAALWMMTHTDCLEILTKVPRVNFAAKGLAVQTWFTEEYTAGQWPVQGRTYQVDHYALRYENWVLKEPRVATAGDRFHVELRALGIPQEHEDNYVHDCFVGMALLCARAGQAEKGVALYNRWAKYYGAKPVEILNSDPLMVDIGSCKIQVLPEEIRLCQ